MKVLLYSGGTDSWLIKELWNPDILLYVDMKTQYSKQEIKRIKKRKEEVKIVSLPLGKWEDKKTAFIPMRNMYLLMVASNYGDEICLGATKEDAGGSSDKDIAFLDEANSMLNRLWKPQSLYDGKEVWIQSYFIDFTKEELLHKYLEKGGNINRFKNETFSCYTPKHRKECMGCKACFRKFIVAYGNGATYTKEEKKKMLSFIEKNVVHRTSHAKGRYFLDKENGKEVLNVIKKLYNEMEEKLDLE